MQIYPIIIRYHKAPPRAIPPSRLQLSGLLQLIDEERFPLQQTINCALIQSCRKSHFPHLLLPGSCAITALHRETHSNLPLRLSDSPASGACTCCRRSAADTEPFRNAPFSVRKIRLISRLFHVTESISAAGILPDGFYTAVYAAEPGFSCAAPQLPADRSH